ncbi:MAG: hypothetical protein ABSD42_02235 [Candidatus Bathyarchaeia archaeon]|jgi:hypothetical protein
MTIDPKLNHRISLVIHSLGLSCLGGAIFLQILVFSNILLQGYFRAVETNPAILTIEITLTAFTSIYFIYVYQRLIRASLKY